MNSSVIAVSARRDTLMSRIGDFVELTKPRITVMVLVTVAVTAFVASWGQPDPRLVLDTVFGTLLIASSASVFNQLLERHTDAQMARTAMRPIPSGRIGPNEALLFGIATLGLGLAYIVVTVGWLPAMWGMATWALYVLVYTPLKVRTSWNTSIGAVAGALPVFIGWTAVEPTFWSVRAMALFALIFLWQYPHFMAIAWIYRGQYAQAGLKMTPVVDNTGWHTGTQAVVGALTLLPVSFLAGLGNPAYMAYVVAAFAIGVFQLGCAVMFFVNKNDQTSRRLLRATLLYLPTLLMMLMLLPWA